MASFHTSTIGKLKTGKLKMLTLAAAGSTLIGCTSIQVQDYKDQKPKLNLIEFLTGELEAYGTVSSRSGKVTRHFTCKMIGTFDGRELTLDETFIWSDGEKQKRVWKLRPVGENKFVGTAGDVVGEAKGETSGNAFRFQYVLQVPVDGKIYDINVDDWMYLVSENVIINKSTLYKFGLRVGEVNLSIIKSQPKK